MLLINLWQRLSQTTSPKPAVPPAIPAKGQPPRPTSDTMDMEYKVPSAVIQDTSYQVPPSKPLHITEKNDSNSSSEQSFSHKNTPNSSPVSISPQTIAINKDSLKGFKTNLKPINKTIKDSNTTNSLVSNFKNKFESPKPSPINNISTKSGSESIKDRIARLNKSQDNEQKPNPTTENKLSDSNLESGKPAWANKPLKPAFKPTGSSISQTNSSTPNPMAKFIKRESTQSLDENKNIEIDDEIYQETSGNSYN